MALLLGANFWLSLLLCFFTRYTVALDASDTWRDADIQQSSYVGGNHNMDPAIVDSSQFGLLWKVATNNQELFYAKPLVYTPSTGTSAGTQIVFMASSQNIVRILDAKTGNILNSRQLHTPFLQSDIGCTDIPYTIGITGTPTIDTNTDTVYFFAKTYIPNLRTSGSTGVFNGVYYFHGIDVTTLQDKPGFPILIDGAIADNDARRYFVGGIALQRPSVLQVGNYIYGAFGAHCDQYNYTGQVIGIDVTKQAIAANFVSQSGIFTQFSDDFNSGSGGGGIWQSGTSIATDNGNRLFFVTGNANGHENNGVPASGASGLQTLGECAVNLAVNDDGSLSLTDYFQPYDYQNMDGGDLDYGSGGIALLDPTVFYGTSVARMAVTAGKNGKIYIMNADNLGGYKQGTGQTDLVIQTIVTSHALFGGSGSYPLEGGYIYLTPVGYPTYAYQLGFDDNGVPEFNLAGQTNEASTGQVGVGIPTITTFKGQPGTAILWMTDPDAGMRAWYAVPQNQVLQTIPLPQIGGVNKFQRPAFGNGMVYTTDQNGFIYCLGAPVNLPLNCTSVNFGDVPIGSSASSSVNCTTTIPVTLTGLTVEDSTFQVSNSSLPTGQLAAGTSFSIPVTWNLTNVVVENAKNASSPEVTPGIKSTPLTIYTVNGATGYATSFPLSLTGNEVSQVPYFDFTPNTVDFGGVVLGVSGENPWTTMTAEIANLGIDSMTILGYAWTMDYPTDSSAVWTNSTPDANGNYYLGSGFSSSTLPALNTIMTGSQSQIIDLLFNATNGTGDYLSYFQVYTNGGSSFIVLEGSASTAPIANFSISTPEGGWLPSTDLNPIMDFGPVMPGNTSSLAIRICNQGGSVLEVTKSKPPSGVIRAAYPGVDLAEGSTIPVGACATGTVLFEPNEEQVNIPDFVEQNTWTLNTNDLTFGVHVVNITGTVHDRQVGLIYPNNQSAQYLYLGCYQDGNPRLLPGEPYSPGLQENGRCIQACYAAGYILAGTEFQDECWCGNSAPPGYLYYPESDDLCTYTCTNDTSQACGGNGGYISVFYDQSRFAPNNQTYNTTMPAPPATVTSVGNYTWVGCYSEGTGGRALTSMNVAALSAGGSVEYCASACAGYAYFGVEYYNECYCGNSISNGAGLISNNASSAVASVSGCNYVCGGNPSEYCGGASKLDIYYTNVTGVSPPVATTAGTGQGSATTTAAGGPTYVPYVNTTNGVWNLIGCYTEATVGRTLTSKSCSNTSNTVELCAAFCSGYTFFGVEWSVECYCGNTIQAGSNPGSSACTMTCDGNTAEYCGGSNVLNMYAPSGMSISTTVASSSAAAAATTTTSGSKTSVSPSVVPTAGAYNFLACYSETSTGRTLGGISFANNSLTVEMCAAYCSGYTYFGVEYACECYCGNSLVGGTTPQAGTPVQGGCNMVCDGNSGEYCGGPVRLNVYVLNPNATATTTSVSAISTSSATSGSYSSSTPSSSPSSISSPPAHFVTTPSANSTTSAPVNSTVSSSSVSATATSFNSSTVVPSSSSAGSSSSPTVSSSSGSILSNSGSSSAVSTSSSSVSSTSSTLTSSALYPTVAVSCPASNGTLWQDSTTGGLFLIDCNTNFAGGDMPNAPIYENNLAQCMSYCAATTGCHAVVWVDGVPQGPCYYKSMVGPTASQAGAWAAYIVSTGGVPSSTLASTTSLSTPSASSGSITPTPTSSISSSSVLSNSSTTGASTSSSATVSPASSTVSSSVPTYSTLSGSTTSVWSTTTLSSSSSSTAQVSSISAASTVSSSTSSSVSSPSSTLSSPTISSSSFSVSIVSSSSSSSTSTSASATPTIANCPASNQTTYITTNGTYLIECYTDHSGGDIPGTGFHCLTFQSCVSNCSATAGCVAFSWSSGPKYCYLKNSIGTPLPNTAVWGGHMIAGPATTSSAAGHKRSAFPKAWSS